MLFTSLVKAIKKDIIETNNLRHAQQVNHVNSASHFLSISLHGWTHQYVEITNSLHDSCYWVPKELEFVYGSIGQLARHQIVKLFLLLASQRASSPVLEKYMLLFHYSRSQLAF